MKQQHHHQWRDWLRRGFQQRWMALLLGMVLTISVLGVWQELFRAELQVGLHSSWPTVVLLGGLVSSWIIALTVYLAQRSELYARQTRSINQQLQQEIIERQKIELKLRSSENSIRNLSARLELAVESAHIGIWDWDIGDDCLIWNDQMYELYGIQSSDFSGVYEAWSGALHPEDFELATTAIQQAMRGEKDYAPEFRVIHPDGTIRFIKAHAIVQRDAQGQAQRMIGVNFDITRQKQAALSLQESESTLRSFFNHESMLMGIVELHDRDILHLSDNQTAANFFGTTPEAMQNRFASEMGVPRSNLQTWMSAYRKAERTQKPVYFEYSHETSTGQSWLAATVCQISSGTSQRSRFSYIVEDVTERKRSETALAKELLRSQTLFNTSIDGVVLLDAWGNVVQTSLSFARMLGYTVEETLTLNVVDWDAQWSAEELKQILQAITPLPNLFETRHRRKDGSCYDVEISYSRTELGGEIVHFCNCRDISTRKQSESALAHLAAIIESSQDAIISKSLEGIVTSWNASAEKLFGYTAAEIVGKSVKLLIPEFLADEEEAILEQIRSGESVSSFDTQRRRKDGRLINVSISISPIKDPKGAIIGASKIARDISDRKYMEVERQRIEDALRKSEARFQAFMNNSPATAWITDANGVMLYASQTYIQTFQLPTADLINKSIFELYPTDVAQHFLDNIQTVAHRQQTLETIEFAPLQDGTMGDFLVYKFPIPDPSGQILVGGVAINITQQRQVEIALQKSEERLQLALEASGDGFWDWNIVTGEVYYSPQYMTMLGYDVGELPHNFETWEYLTHPDDKPWVLDILNAHIKDGSRQYSFDYRVRTKSGEWKWVADYGKVITRDAQGKPLRMIGTHQDISDRKQKEAALQQAMEAAEASNLAKSMFLANMSHELRTPLNVILGFTQVMSHDASLTPTQRDDLQTIRRSGDHLLSLINDVLDLSKIEAGHCTLEESGFDLISLLHTLRTMMIERAKAKQLQLTFEIAPEVPQFVIADEQKLRQILLNLLSNAIKFTKQGSVILRVSSWESSPKNCLVSSASQHDSLDRSNSSVAYTIQFEVVDTGVGIDATERETIFDAFVQAEAGRISTGGTGLGLTINRKLLELMGGSISVESTPEMGSTFTVTVPVCPTSGVDGQPEQPERTIIGLVPGQTHRRVLVVDDQLENRKLLVRLLTYLGMEVQEATNGQEAIALWQQWKPDLTWMDIRMPLLDGYEATKQIRAMEQDQASIIIALTAQASQSDRALALAAGCNDYISKPFREETLFLKLKEYLGLEYIYAEAAELSDLSSATKLDLNTDCWNSVDAAMLAQVPADWLERLEDLALCGNDRAIVDLVNQLAPEFKNFKAQLLDLASKFEFEQIVQLIQRGSSP